MKVSKMLIVSIALLTLVCSKDFSSETYLKQSAYEKMNQVWTEVSKDTTPMQFYSPLEVAKIFLSDLKVTFNYKGDVLPEDRKKLIHTLGNIAQADWVSTGDHPYTGIFKGSTQFLVRFSVAKQMDTSKTKAQEALGNFAPGISLKFLRSGVDSANLVAMFSTGGQASWNPFKNDFTNNFRLNSPSVAEFALSAKFSSVTNNISAVGLKDMAMFDQDGKKADDLRYPFKLIFRPTSEVNNRFSEDFTQEFTHQLAGIVVGTTLYDVYAIDKPGCPEVKIAKIITKTKMINSKFGDEKLFFRHGLIDDDDKGKDWADYRDYFSVFGGLTSAKIAKPKSACPFASLF
jgi:hypothetical protein